MLDSGVGSTTQSRMLSKNHLRILREIQLRIEKRSKRIYLKTAWDGAIEAIRSSRAEKRSPVAELAPAESALLGFQGQCIGIL